MDLKALFFTAQGRIGRKDFWVGFLIILAISFVTGMIPVIGQIIGIVLIWPQVCIHAKRLHDMGLTGWLMAIPFAVSLVCFIAAVIVGGPAMFGAMSGDAGAAITGMGAAMGLIAIAFFVGFAFLLWVGLTKGQPGDNRFGSPPAAA